MAGAIAQDRQRCQFPFVVDEKPTVVSVRSAGERSGGARKVSCGAARSNSGRAAPSACVGRRFSAAQIIWNRSTRRAGARGGARVDRPRWLRILTITGGSSMAAEFGAVALQTVEVIFVVVVATKCFCVVDCRARCRGKGDRAQRLWDGGPWRERDQETLVASRL